ncbi:MAG TPA: hypothetical protein VH879_07175 [Gemmatimonadales bacterium]|jgi:hypothetical protein
MSKSTESNNPIEKLLQDRAQYVNWLTRLNASGEASTSVPEAVRGRVRADYERRLEAVLAELRSHTAQLEEQVEGLTARASELTVRESERKEQLAEAEVRHLVGEYDEVKWDGIRTELLKLIGQVHDELQHTTTEIDRLTEVLGTIHAPMTPQAPAATPEPRPSITSSAPRPAATIPAAKAPVTTEPAIPPLPSPPAETARPAASHPSPAATGGGGTEIPFRPSTPRPATKPAAVPPKREDQPGRTLWFPSGKPDQPQAGGGKLDELAFLKSVTGDEAPVAPPPAPAPAPVPAPRLRTSGGFSKPADAPAAPTPVPEPAPTRPPSALDGAKDRPSAGPKTLKCGECGTLNRPTEWYCERCGAELAAL